MKPVENFSLDIKVQFETAKSDRLATLVIFVGQADKKEHSKRKKATESSTASPVFDAEIVPRSKVQTFIDDVSFAGKFGETSFIRNIGGRFCNLLLVGLGARQRISHECFRKAVGAAHKVLANQKVASVVVDMKSGEFFLKDTMLLAKTLTEGFVMASYKFTDCKPLEQKKEALERRCPKYVFLHLANRNEDRAAKIGINLGQIFGEETNFARRLGDMPGNLMTPSQLAQTTKSRARSFGLSVKIWDKTRIQKERMGCFLGVAKGSEEPPKLIILEYKGASKTSTPICYVGKAITFDSGGISIKPSQAMEEMKYDMCGGAAVIATMNAIARLKLKVNAIAIVPSCENMPGPCATKPGDVHTARNGKTVEINNTDAEGRLILADALVYACEQNPAFIVDAATLTGAMKIALGDNHTGYFCRGDELSKRISDAADASGEALWEMPLVEDHLKDMRGTYAELSNMSSISGAGSAKGAAFLGEFVEKSIPWAHFDIAGTAWHTHHRLSYCPDKGATGVIVRTFIELARQFKG